MAPRHVTHRYWCKARAFGNGADTADEDLREVDVVSLDRKTVVTPKANNKRGLVEGLGFLLPARVCRRRTPTLNLEPERTRESEVNELCLEEAHLGQGLEEGTEKLHTHQGVHRPTIK